MAGVGTVSALRGPRPDRGQGRAAALERLPAGRSGCSARGELEHPSFARQLSSRKLEKVAPPVLVTAHRRGPRLCSHGTFSRPSRKDSAVGTRRLRFSQPVRSLPPILIFFFFFFSGGLRGFAGSPCAVFTCSAQPGRSLGGLEHSPVLLSETWSHVDPQETASRYRSFTSRDKARRRDWPREQQIYWGIFFEGFSFSTGRWGLLC